MAPNFKGYDIQSFSKVDDDKPERYIEVKALRDDWGEVGVGLTKSEFNEATLKGERYWLYVVENAGGPGCNHLSHPKSRSPCDSLFFDGGWKGISNSD
ncbi:hypothetical protein BH20ACI2_BH20ACI2_21390 [soil metagenome]